MERLKKGRRPVRVTVTRLLNEVGLLLDGSNPDKDIVQAKWQLLQKYMESLQEWDQKVISQLLEDDCEDETVDAEHTAMFEYAERYGFCKLKVDQLLDSKKHSSSHHSDDEQTVDSYYSVAGGNNQKSYKLPKIELKKFNGDLKNWLGFWSQFSKIHEDASLHDADKFQYLVQSMESGTEPEELVTSYPLTASNYSKAVEALQERYGRDSLLLQVYIRELLKLVISNVNHRDKLPLDRMYLKLESHLRALKALNLAQADPATWLFPLVESSLPEDVLRAWQRSPMSKLNDDTSNKSCLDTLMDFVKSEVQNEQQISLARTGFQAESEDSNKSMVKKTRKHVEDKIPTAAGLHATMRVVCIFCDKGHESKDCFKAKTMTLEQKVDKIKAKQLCLLCFRAGHRAKNCRIKLKCLICSKRHFEMMCPEIHQNKVEVNRADNAESQHSVFSDAARDTLSHLNCTSEVLLQTLLVDVVNGNNRKTVRALLDSGSQRSYILKKTVEELKLASKSEVRLRHLLFGGSCEERLHREYEVCLQNSRHVRGNGTVTLRVLDQQQICGHIPRMCKGPWMHELRQRKIYVADLGGNSSEVELLIGADCYGHIATGRINQLSNGLTAIETRLGWTLSGRCDENPVPDSSVAMNVISMHVSDAAISQLWELETIGINDPVDVKSQQERNMEIKQHLRETVIRGQTGRYSVSLPWISGTCIPKISNNKRIAGRRLEVTTRKLVDVNMFEEYNNIFHQWESEGFIEETELDYEGPSYYLPHRAVIKSESTTTPIRPVFDASSKGPHSHSLNDCLEKGPNLLQLMPDIILRFRMKNIGFVSDIRKAFQMIEICERDRDFLRFLWWEDLSEQKLKAYRHQRVVFGVNCSPFLLSSVIEIHLGQVKEEDKSVAEKLLESFYVDNCVASVDSLEEYEHFKEHATRIMSEAGMDLRQWAATVVDTAEVKKLCSSECRYTEQSVTPVLGLRWDRVQDSLFCDVTPLVNMEKVTKRTVLSVVSRVFDPIGFTSPALLLPKLLLQESWAAKLSWDEELPVEGKTKFVKWNTELNQLNFIRIPRHMKMRLSMQSNLQLHGFSDASQDAYAAVIFLRASENESVSVQLLLAKSRVAPLKRPTIPRLELLGCVIAVRLMRQVKEALKMNDVPTYFWSDSSTALAWIRRNENWSTFVRNRVEEIHKVTEPTQWRHVPGTLNPADLPSRGCMASQLLESKWWEGPMWLRHHEGDWLNTTRENLEADEAIITSEIMKTGITRTMIAHEDSQNLWYVQHFSSYMKNIKMIAWITRFIDKCRKKSSESEPLTVKEIEEAEKAVFRLVQKEIFDESSSLNGLSVSIDSEGLLRVNTKLIYRDDANCFRLPVILPRKHPIVDQLITHAHVVNGHAGIQFLMSHLRERVWIIQSRRSIRRVISQCKICRRHTAKSANVDPAPLPANRVQTVAPFQVTGVDLAGPLYLRKGEKAWVVLFTCAVYRCVHLDFVLSLSTEAFLAALHRFVCCRGRPSTLYSDNGSNFTGADRAFKNLNWSEIQKVCAVQRIQWIFNPPSAAWWGGWWERLIRTAKDLLKRMLGRGRVDCEGLRTCLSTVESTMNQRPLTTVTEDADDLIPLTPAMFLRGIPGSDFPEYEEISSEQLQHVHKGRTTLLRELQTRFRNEYLSQLVQRSNERKGTILTVGDVVLIGQDNRKRLDWPLGRIIDILPGKDGKVRVARVKTMYGELIRPVQRLFPLEMSSTDSIPLQEHVKKTRRGRVVKLPSKFKDVD